MNTAKIFPIDDSHVFNSLLTRPQLSLLSHIYLWLSAFVFPFRDLKLEVAIVLNELNALRIISTTVLIHSNDIT